ncbi:MAG: NifB/NifX family molybdenum-iron cluster-binding protein [Terriglobia bacterium]|nr:NifB/NifX family molybdenum-iron cluster-binding protein [Terriglobia bacterium]
MKVAVATTDGTLLSQHFGRSMGFVIFDVEGKDFHRRELRANNHTPHAQGQCGHHDGQHHGEHQGTHHHNSIVELLSDCSFVLCGGMGAGAVSALRANGIQPVMVRGAHSVEDAMTAHLKGNAAIMETGACDHSHA